MKNDLQAFIFGAGFGIRLLPLTEERPKVTVPVLNKPVIFRIIENLSSFGIDHFVINSHYKPQILHDIVGDGKKWGVDIQYSHEDAILETGGGLKKAQNLINSQTFILHNGDIICDVDFQKLLEFHKSKGAVATLVVSKYHDPKQVTIDSTGKIIDIRNTFYKDIIPGYTFLGIHILEKKIFDMIEPDKKISIIPIYLKMISEGMPVYVWEIENGLWYDIGSIEQYKKANLDLAEKYFSNSRETRLYKSSNSYIDSNVSLNGLVCIGENSVIEKKVFLKNAILWNNVHIKEGSVLEDVIIRDSKFVSGNHKGEII